MVLFFKTPSRNVIAVDTDHTLSSHETEKLSWLFSEAEVLNEQIIDGWFVGPRKEMITPWSTNAVEITQNMGLKGITRIEEYFPVKSEKADHDPMLQRMYNGLNQSIFEINKLPDPIVYIDDIASYSKQEGLALSEDKINYLNDLGKKIGRKLTDSRSIQGFPKSTQNIADIKYSMEFLSSTDKKKKALYLN